MNQKQLKTVIIILGVLAAISICTMGYFSYKLGVEEGHKDCGLTPDSKEFLHGKILDLPEELTALDTTYIMSIKRGDTIHQSIFLLVWEGINDKK